MLVDVVLTRREGKKLTPEELSAAQPVRGYIRIRSYKAADGAGITASATLHCGTSPGAMMNLPPLSNARIRSWEGASLMLHGSEFVNRQGRPGDVYPQGWWVRIVTPQG